MFTLVFHTICTWLDIVRLFCLLLIIRKLDHPNVVKVYGTSLLKEKDRDSVRMILVMEKCKGNLGSRIFKHPESVPGKTDDPGVVREAFRWVEGITDALAYIHEQGIVHRDLKLENILVRRYRRSPLPGGYILLQFFYF